MTGVTRSPRTMPFLRGFLQTIGVLILLGLLMAIGLSLLALLVWVRKQHPEVLPPQLMDETLFDWSEKAVAIAIGAAGSFAAIAISLVTFRAQSGIERDRDERVADEAKKLKQAENTAHERKYQALYDAIETLFVEADYIISLVIAPVTKGDVTVAGQRARRLEARLEAAQAAVWTAIEEVCVSDDPSRLKTLPELWDKYTDSNTPLSTAYLRRSGLFGLKQDPKLALKRLGEIVDVLKTSRVEPNTQRRLRNFVTETTITRFRYSAREAERSLEDGVSDVLHDRQLIRPDLSKLIASFESEEGLGELIQTFNKHLESAIEELKTSDGRIKDDLSEDDAPSAFNHWMSEADALRGELVKALGESKIRKVNKASQQKMLGKLDQISADLSRFKVRQAKWLLDARHDPEGALWLRRCRVAMAGMILVPETLWAGVKVQREVLQVNVGLLFLIDLCAALHGNLRAGNIHVRLGHFTRTHLADPEILVKAAVSSVDEHEASVFEFSSCDLDLGDGVKSYSFLTWPIKANTSPCILPGMRASPAEVFAEMAEDQQKTKPTGQTSPTDKETDDQIPF